MKYLDWLKAMEQQRNYDRALRREGEKRYLLRNGVGAEPTDYRSVNTPADAALWVRVSISEYLADNPTHPQISMLVDQHGYGTLSHPLSELAPSELRRLADLGDVVKRWLTGEIDSLPDRPPWE